MKVGSFGAARDRSLRLQSAQVEPDEFDFCGQSFRVAEEVGAMPLLRFAAAAGQGLDSESLDGLVAMMEMIRDTIHPDDWTRFQRVATDEKAGGDLLMEVCQALYQHIAARPTVRPTDSSSGPSATSSDSNPPSSYAPSPFAHAGTPGTYGAGPVLAIPTNGSTVSPPGLLAPSPTPS